MAKLFLDANDTFTVSDDVQVFGAAGSENVKISGTPNVQLDANVERIELSGNSGDYTYLVQGTTITVLSGGNPVATLNGLNQDATVAFADGSAVLSLTGLDTATLGGTALPSDAAAAVVPGTIDATDVSDTAGGTTEPTEPAFDLTAALTTLQTAQTAESDFLTAQIDNELLTAAALDENSTLAAIRTAIDTAVTDANFALDADLADGSDNILAATLVDAQDALATATANVNAVEGLAAKIEAVTTTTDALAAATAAEATATAAQAGAKANYDSLNAANITINADGTVANLIELNVDTLVLAGGITEATNPGVTALLAAINDQLAAVEATAAAQTAKDAADADVVSADETQVVTDLSTMTGAIAGASVGASEAATETTFTDATAAAVTAGAITAAQKASIDAAVAAEITATNDTAELDAAKAAAAAIYGDIVTAAEAAEAAAIEEAALVVAYNDAVTAEANAQAQVDERADLRADVAAAEALNAEADALATAITDAEQALTDEGYAVNSIDAANEVGTAADDIYLLGDAVSAIANFELTVTDAEGNVTAGDSIFVGQQLAIVSGDDVAANLGDAAVQELIVIDNGTDTVLYFEGADATFAGNSTVTGDFAAAITLTGVTGGTVAIDADGFLSIA